jgi:transcriptional regulator of acetoin/glycerol metabolism
MRPMDQHDPPSGVSLDIEQLRTLLATLAEVPKLSDLHLADVLLALQRNDGNRTRASHALGISVRTLQRTLKRLGAEQL